MKKVPNEFVIFDTEYTAWEGSWERGWSGEGEYKEIIQLGAIKVRDLKEVDNLLIYIAPNINVNLSDYIIGLTGVTQADVDTKGVSFPEAYRDFVGFKGSLQAYSYGTDHKILAINHELCNTGETIDIEQYNDVRDIFNDAGIETGKYMSSTIPEAFGLAPPPAGHDALNDARSILLALRALYDLNG